MNAFSALPIELLKMLTNYFLDIDIHQFALMNRRTKSTNCQKILIDNNLMYRLIKHGYLDWIIYFSKTRKLPEDGCLKAVKYDRVNLVRYFHRQNNYFNRWIAHTAASEGAIECLKYAYETTIDPDQEYRCAWTGDICQQAAKHGHLECLKYAHEHDCPWNSYTCQDASLHGNFECLKYAIENGCQYDSMTANDATINGTLKCLKYLREKKCEMTNITCNYAVIYNRLDCLKYLIDTGCSFIKRECLQIAEIYKCDEITNYLNTLPD